MNLRPSGYEPDELPDCSTPHQEGREVYGPMALNSTQCAFDENHQPLRPDAEDDHGEGIQR